MSLNLLSTSGSLRTGSYCSAIARAAASLTPDGVTCEMVNLIEALPHYNADLDLAPDGPIPAPVAEVRRRITEASGLLIVTPEYNYGLPGALKNLVDWASRPFKKHCLIGKPVAVIGASPSGRGGLGPVEYLRTILPALGATLVGDEVLVGQVDTKIDPETGELSDELAEQVRSALQALADAARTVPAS